MKAEHEGLNTRQLAEQLGRDYKNVYTDTKSSWSLGCWIRTVGGRLTAPLTRSSFMQQSGMQHEGGYECNKNYLQVSGIE